MIFFVNKTFSRLMEELSKYSGFFPDKNNIALFINLFWDNVFAGERFRLKTGTIVFCKGKKVIKSFYSLGSKKVKFLQFIN